MDKSFQRDIFSPIVGNEALMGPFLLIARLMTASVFVLYISNLLRGGSIVERPGMPAGALYFFLAIQFIGVAMVIVGYGTRVAALLMAAFCIATTVLFTGSTGWSGMFMTHMLKDLAVAAGFLFLFAQGPGPLSVDGRSSRGETMGSGRAADVLLLAGRVMAAVLFFYYGRYKIMNTAAMQAYMIKHNSHVPPELIYLAILTQIVPPLLMVLGYKTRYAALALSGFCLIATALFHADFGNPAEVEQVLLDVSIAGGLLFLFAHGPGRLSLDARQGKTLSAGQGAEALSAKGL
jgi:putative oxidoreductase